MEYYSAIINKLEMYTTWVNLKGIMLNEKCQFHTVSFH